MEDKQEQTIEKYGFQVKNRYRARGAILLDTEEGPRLMREYEKIQGHFSFANEVKKLLYDSGMTLTDRVVPNLEGDLVTEWESGEKYVVYEWYYGENCDYRSRHGLLKAAENLGCLHNRLKGTAPEPIRLEEDLIQRYERHNRELKRVYTYMKEKKRKNEFELSAICCFPEFYNKAKKVAEQLKECRYYRVHGSVTRDLCHGEYNYHNLIFTKKGVATTNFERTGYGIQWMDLAYFMRKTMEKNGWDVEKGAAVLEGYRREKKIEEDDVEFLLLVLTYPVKYWKLMNQYINGKKSWMSSKNMEKLIGVREQEKARENFIKEIAGNENIHWSYL